MSFDQRSFIVAYDATQAAEGVLREAQENLERNRAILKKEWVKLLEAIKSVFEEELLAFTVSMPYRIWKGGYCFTLDEQKRAICVDITLKNRMGSQPDEFFTEDDVRELSERFAIAINPRLVEVGVAFTFGGFIFPPEYIKK